MGHDSPTKGKKIYELVKGLKKHIESATKKLGIYHMAKKTGQERGFKERWGGKFGSKKGWTYNHFKNSIKKKLNVWQATA